jgi:iron complex outermembrane receptor protein
MADSPLHPSLLSLRTRHLVLTPLFLLLLQASSAAFAEDAADALAAAQGPYPAASQPTQNLKALSLEQLGNVEVTTQSKEPAEVWNAPAAVYVLTQEDIRRSGAATLPDLLRTVPGLEVAEFEGNQWAVGIRGFNSAFSKDILLLIDGRSTYTELFEGVYWDVQDVLLDDIDRIEIIRGPGGTIWGANAVNGVINIITKRAADTQGTLATGFSGQVDRFTGAIRQGFQLNPNLQLRLFGKGLVREDELNPHYDPYDRWHLGHGGARLDWTPTQRDSVTVEADGYTGQSGQAVSVGSLSPFAQVVFDDTFAISGGDLLVAWQRRYTGGSDFHFDGYVDRTNRQGQEFGEGRTTYDLDFINHLAMLPREDLIWGAGVRFSPSNFVQTLPTVDFEPHQETDYIYSGFLQDSFRVVPDRLTLTFGSKFEDNNYTGFEIQPSARALWNIVPHSMLWGAISRAVRTPGRLDRDVLLTDVDVVSPPILARIWGDPTFKSEVLIGYEAGYRQLLTHNLYADVAAFHNQYDNLEGFGPRFTTANTSPPARIINIPFANAIKGVTDGIEIAPDWKPTSWWELKGNFSHVHVAVRDKPGFTDTSTPASDMGSSPHRTATLQSLFNLPHQTEFDFDYRFVSRLPAQNVLAYQTMDLHASWLPIKSLRLTVAARNLLQPHHNEFAGDNDNPVGIRRTVSAGITWTR